MTSTVVSDAAAQRLAVPSRTYEVRTYGCQMNVHDSERLAGLLEAAGYRRAAELADDDVATCSAIGSAGRCESSTTRPTSPMR